MMPGPLGKNIKRYGPEKLSPATMEGSSADEDAAWQELSAVLEARIADGRQSSQSFEEIVEAAITRAKQFG